MSQQEKNTVGGESSTAAAESLEAEKNKAKAEKEERRRQHMLKMQKEGLVDSKGAIIKESKKMTKAERRAKQERERAAKQAKGQQHQNQQHQDNDAAGGGSSSGHQATAGSAVASTGGGQSTAQFNMNNRLFLEDKRMYLYSHLELPNHPPTSASALALGQMLNVNSTATAERGTGDARALVAGIKNASFPPGPQVIVGQARDAYVEAEAKEPVTVTVTGAAGAPVEATIRDAMPPFVSGPGQRRFAKTTGQTIGMTIHPRIKEIGLRMGAMDITGANARTVSVLAAFIDVIADYTTPPHTSLYRHLQTYLSPQINFLVHQRAMCVGMGNAIRWMKDEIMRIPADMDETTAKSTLITRIQDYVKERITAAGDAIAAAGISKIKDGDVILTYGASSAVQRLLIAAHRDGRRFRVIVVDSRPHFEGRRLVRRLIAAGLTDIYDECCAKVAAPTDLGNLRGKYRGRNGSNGGLTYAPITALGYIMREASKVFLGAEAFFANGSMLSKAGTAMVALAAQQHHVPVIVTCETYKFSERVQLDAVVSNELGVPDTLMYKSGIHEAEPIGVNADLALSEMEYSAYARDKFSARPRWNNYRSPTTDTANEPPTAAKHGRAAKPAKGVIPGTIDADAKAKVALSLRCPLSDWRETRNLRLLNLTQDITPPDFVSMIITEVGMIPTTSIPVVLREYKNQV